MTREYFEAEGFRHEMPGSAFCAPWELHAQRRDWTCAVACLRSLLSGIVTVPSETLFVTSNELRPGPLYSADLKAFTAPPVMFDPRVEIRFGCDDPERDVLDGSDVWTWLRAGYRVMVDWMMSYDHWCVVMGYFPDADVNRSTVVYYDPYYDEIRSCHGPDFEVMWRSGRDASLVHDYVIARERAVR